MIACFALAVRVVRCQSRRRASKHEEKSGHKDERVDGQAPRERGSTGYKLAERFQMPTSTWKWAIASPPSWTPTPSAQGDMSQNAPLSVP